jgi:hypothetical protein
MTGEAQQRRGAGRSPASSRRARAAGIETVYQTLAVAPGLDIADNLLLGHESARRGCRHRLADPPGHAGLALRTSHPRPPHRALSAADQDVGQARYSSGVTAYLLWWVEVQDPDWTASQCARPVRSADELSRDDVGWLGYR